MFVQYFTFVSNIIALIPFFQLGDSIVAVNFHTIIARTAWQAGLSHRSSRPASPEYANNP